MNRTARTFYTEYVLHAARFYARNLHLRGKMDFKSGADMLNWNACIKTLTLFDKCDQEILLEVFRSREPLAESVSAAAVKRGLYDARVWGLLATFARSFAESRGLI